MMVSPVMGIIPDGNRRFAKKHGVPLFLAYKKGLETMRKALNFLQKETDTKYAYIYALSLENLQKRTPQELSILFKLMKNELNRELSHPSGAEFHFGGELHLLPKDLLSLINKVEKKSEGGNPKIGVMLAYSGWKEIERAAHLLQKGEINSLREGFYLPHFPDVDLLLRTSGEMRLSGFLPYQTMYAEFVFYEKLWPEMEEGDFRKVLDIYRRRERRFGR